MADKTKKSPPAKPELYDVGFAKPPVHTRFPKGRSGNPRGRPKGALNLRSAVLKALAEKVDIKEGGTRKRITRLEATAKQLAIRLANGDPRALQQLFGAAPMLGLTAAPESDAPLTSAADEQVLLQMLARMQDAGFGAKAPEGSTVENSAAPVDPKADYED